MRCLKVEMRGARHEDYEVVVEICHEVFEG